MSAAVHSNVLKPEVQNDKTSGSGAKPGFPPDSDPKRHFDLLQVMNLTTGKAQEAFKSC
jgi:hypothetical protein